MTTTYRILKQDHLKAVSELIGFVNLEEDERIVIQRRTPNPVFSDVTEIIERVV